MSLINDALKRATQAQTPKTPAADGDSSMQPAESHGSVGLPVYFMPVLLFVVAGAGFFIVQGWDARRQAGVYPQAVSIHAREATPASTAAAPDPAALAAKERSAEPTPANRQFSITETLTTLPVGAAAVDDADIPPPLRLQGIFYRPSRPSAVVNSQTVYIGDSVGGGTVKAIGRESVTLVVHGETKVLTLR